MASLRHDSPMIFHSPQPQKEQQIAGMGPHSHYKRLTTFA